MKVLLYDEKNCFAQEVKEILLGSDCYSNIDLDVYEHIGKVRKALKIVDYAVAYLVINNNDDISYIEEIYDISSNVVIIILLCNSKKYVHEAFRNKVFQYLTNPLDCDLFRYEFNRAVKEFQMKNRFKIFKLKEEKRLFDLDEIIMIESYYNSTYIITTQGSFETNRKNLLKIKEEVMNHDFILLQSGYIVNMNYIVSMKYREAVLKNGKIVPISLAYFKLVKGKYMKFLNNRLSLNSVNKK